MEDATEHFSLAPDSSNNNGLHFFWHERSEVAGDDDVDTDEDEEDENCEGYWANEYPEEEDDETDEEGEELETRFARAMDIPHGEGDNASDTYDEDE